jgi:serine/threonine protein kinase/Tol biopolymer transport system component
MSLTAGSRVGPYEVVALLGKGGMGEVYRAHDSALGRDVALKVLPEAFLHDPERLARFRREAQVLASLNHPNIGAVYGIEGHALVMELVDGEDLSARVARGPTRTDDALPIAAQIVAALAAAHERGVIHRDLKPSNIKVRPDGTVKVLDFGLAKALDATASSAAADMANSPTITSPAMTELGMILGTAAYMAPEQARGRNVDERVDVWAFGCVLYELLTGRRAFAGEDVSDTLAGILRADPDWRAVPATTPPSIQRLLRRCLAKDPAKRLPDIRAAQLDIDDAASSETTAPAPAATKTTSSRAAWLMAAGLTLAVFVLGGWLIFRKDPPADPPTVVRFLLYPPAGFAFSPSAFDAVGSPDGRRFAFVAERVDGGQRQLFVRDLDQVASRPLAGTDNAALPFWSPDSRELGFFDNASLKKVELGGGVVTRLAAAPPAAGAWTPDGTIIFGGLGGIKRMPASGGEPVLVTHVASGETAHGLPSLLPDGRRFLFTVQPAGTIRMASLDSSQVAEVPNRSGPGVYAAGQLLFVENGRLMAQPFDLSNPTAAAEAVPLTDTDRVASVTSATMVAFRPGAAAITQAEWVDRTGKDLGSIAGIGRPQHPTISRDGRMLAYVVDGDLWVVDLRGRPPIRLTFDGTKVPKYSPLWSPDGRRLAYEVGGGSAGLASIAADGSEGTPAAMSPPGHLHPYAWTGDGIIAAALGGPQQTDILRITADGKETKPVVQTPAHEGLNGLALSPDGRWLAYAADPTGRGEIWVRPYPGPGPPVRVSPSGGEEPRWAANGRELFYREGRVMMSTPVQGGADFQFGTPIRLFDGPFVRAGQPYDYDVAADGRFLMLKSGDASAAPEPLTMVLNWTQLIGALGSPKH